MSVSNTANRAEQSLQEAEEMTDIEFSEFIDDVEDADLPAGSPLAVSTEPNYLGYEPEVTLLVDPEFNYLNRHQQRIGAEHEGFHAMRQKGALRPFLRERGDPELSRALNTLDSHNSEHYEEGLVQLLANTVDPYGQEGEVFRRQETSDVESFLEEEGVEDLEDVIDGTQNMIDDVVDRYREVEEVHTFDDYRVEIGNYGGDNYAVVAEDEQQVIDTLADYSVGNYSENEYEEEKENVWEPSLFIPESYD
jgi:hypothetical protein